MELGRKSLEARRHDVQAHPTCKARRFGRSASFGAVVVASLSLAGCLTATPQQNSDMSPHLAAISPSAGDADNANSLLRIANGIAAEGDYSAALPVYRRAYQKDGDTASLIALGRALNAVGDYSEAAALFQKSHAPAAQRGLANAYTGMGRPDDALPVLDRILTTNPVDVDALNSRAVVLDALGRHDEAVATYERGLGIDPEAGGLRHNYGLSLALAGTDFPRALALSKAGNVGREATAADRQSLALVYFLAGDATAAERLLTIDLGLAETEKKLAWFEVIKALPMAEKFHAVMTGSLEPKPDVVPPAVRIYDAPAPEKTATAARVMNDPALAQAAPQPAAVEAKPESEATAATAAPEKPVYKAKKPARMAHRSIPAEAATGGWTIQIASYRQESQLETGWRILKARYGDVLGSLTPSHAEIDFGNQPKHPKGIYYRLLSGPMKTRAEAVEACGRLRRQGAECMVRAPGSGASEI